MVPEVEVRPVVPQLWNDLARLFSASPSTQCWCMWPRLPVGAMWGRGQDENREDMKRLVEQGTVPGLLAYVAGRPAGWVAVGPRPSFARLDRGSDPTRWVIACVYVSGADRGSGVARALIDAALGFAHEHGAGIIEALPRGWRTDEGDSGRQSLFQMLRKAGFEEVDAEREGVHFRTRFLP